MKEIYHRQQLQPPRLEQWPEARQQYRELLQLYSSGAYKHWTMRELFQKSWVAIEIFGFFIIGEILGRRSLIGYNIKTHDSVDNEHHHHH
jgi:F-type H+-transporting ATPase subunit g